MALRTPADVDPAEFTSLNEGFYRTWQATGAVEGAVEALTYSSEMQTLIAYDSRGIVVSNDLGANWQVLVNR